MEWVRDKSGKITVEPVANWQVASFPDAVLIAIQVVEDVDQYGVRPDEARRMARQLLQAADDAERKPS